MTDTLLASIDRILSWASTDLQDIDEIAETRTLTADETLERRRLRKLVDAQARIRATLVD